MSKIKRYGKRGLIGYGAVDIFYWIVLKPKLRRHLGIEVKHRYRFI